MEQHSDDKPNSQSEQRKSCARGWKFKLAALGLTIVSALAGTGLAHWLREPPPKKPAAPSAAPAKDGPLPAHLFRGWSKPDFALIITAQQHGYLLPCGCSRPQVGGLERRYNFMQILREKGWPLVPVDLGDIPQKEGPVHLPNLQGLIKYRYSMKALQRMRYAAVGVGEYEAAMPLFRLVGEWSLNETTPAVLAANLKDTQQFYFPDILNKWHLANVGQTKIGITSIVGPSTIGKIKDPQVSFAGTRETVNNILAEMDKAKVDLRILLYHGSLTRGWKEHPPEALAVAKAFPQFQVVVGVSEEDEPSADPRTIKFSDGSETMVIGMGQKGKYVGVVGMYQTNRRTRPFDLKYQLVQMSEDFMTPEDKVEDQPIVSLMEQYTTELKMNNYLTRVGQSRHTSQVAFNDEVPTYIGSEKCKKCHESAYEVWKKSPHSHAYQTLVDAELPSNRQYDPECVVCHTVGFGYHTGFQTLETTSHLTDVGCESCHGPCSSHAKTPLSEKWYPLINPWRPKDGETAEEKAKRQGRIDQFCQKCHDIDNDVTWTNNGFEKKWPKIAHPSPWRLEE